MTEKDPTALRYTRLFPTEEGDNLSHVFDVRSDPVVINAFGLKDGQELRVEMVYDQDCENFIAPYSPCCCQVRLTYQSNSLVLGVTGSYRLFVHDPNGLGYEDLAVYYMTALSHVEPSQCHCGCD